MKYDEISLEGFFSFCNVSYRYTPFVLPNINLHLPLIKGVKSVKYEVWYLFIIKHAISETYMSLMQVYSHIMISLYFQITQRTLEYGYVIV